MSQANCVEQPRFTKSQSMSLLLTDFFELSEKIKTERKSASTRPVGFAAGKNLLLNMIGWFDLLVLLAPAHVSIKASRL